MRYKVLIAGDNKRSLTILRKSLEPYTSEFSVHCSWYSDNNTILHPCGIPDIVILDFDDIGSKGMSLLKKIRETPLLFGVPLLMTSRLPSKEIQRAIIAGADDFIKKPVHHVELNIRIKYLIQKNILYRENSRQSDELRKLSLVADRTENSVLITNTRGELEWVNKAFERLYGYTLKEFTEKYGRDIRTVSPRFAEAMQKCHKKRKWQVYESSHISKDGEKKWIQTSLTPVISDEDQKITNFIAVETDISKLKVAQERMLELNQDMVDLTVSLEQINLKLEEKQKEVNKQKKLAEEQKKLADNLLLNLFPYEIAEQLKIKGTAKPKHYRMVSIMFTDFVGFSKLSDQLSIHELIKELSMYFEKFDIITREHYIEKIKTIGDAYMCAGGLPLRNRSNPIDTALAALEIQKFVRETNERQLAENKPKWEIRLGIHTGEVIAGVIGKSKMAYDIWGDAVNTASRLENNGEPNRINISGSTYKYISNYFECSYRGKIQVHNKGEVEMYFLNRLREEYSEDDEGIVPNNTFRKILAEF